MSNAILVNGIEYVLVSTAQAGEFAGRDMTARGWEPELYEIRRPRGRRSYVAFKSRATGCFSIVQGL